MNVIAIESEKTQAYIRQTPTIGMTVTNGKIEGRYEAKGGECVFLSIAYDKGLTLRINGEKRTLYEVYGGFTAFYLEEGDNEIQITFCPQGFTLGLGVSIFGGVLLILWMCLSCRNMVWKRKTGTLLEIVAYYGVFVVGVLVVVIIYVAPMILCAL